jgi:D-amino-acid dehydrogenase
VDIEPALESARPRLAGATFSRDDESGDAHLFTAGLAGWAQRLGATFQGATTIQAIEAKEGRFAAVLTDQGRFEADACLLALGSYSPQLTQPLGFTLPVVPAKGYSATFDPAGPGAPTVSITDDECKMVYSRLGGRLRVAGTAEFSGYDASLNETRARLIVSRALGLFPGAGDPAKAALWAGLRPVTPDSVPLIGPSPLAGLFLNTGHGTLGWTMGVGSGRLIADLMLGKKPAIDPEGLGLERF